MYIKPSKITQNTSQNGTKRGSKSGTKSNDSAMSLQEEHQMLATSHSTSSGSRTRDPAPAPSLAVADAQPMPYAQIFPGQQANPIDADHPPPLIPTSVLREIVNRSMPTKRSRRLRNIVPGDIPPAIPRSQSGPRRPTPLERMNLVDEENVQTDSDDEDYVPPESLKASSFIPDLTPEEIEAINAVAGTPPVTEKAAAPADDLAVVAVKAPPSAVVSPSLAQENPVPSSPSIPHTDFFSEENTAPPQSFDYVSDSSSAESSDYWDDSLANYVVKRRAKKSGSQFVKPSNDEDPDDSEDKDFDDNVVGNAVSTSDTSNSSFEEEDAAQVLTSMPAEQSPPSDDVDKMIDDYEPEVAEEDDVNIAAIAPHSNKFLTAEAEVKFADLME
ncbi:hypothetical protein CASFOL_011115 [Castilleja foliolosa]|uniref:Uncharacterized protein n=1 Tax=Castilleja foliolosa TaxID=1961234 RepID=A0ABD3DUL7_9LAMI